MLEIHQPQVPLHGNRRTTLIGHEPLPERLKKPVVIEQGVDGGQLLGKDLDFGGQELVPQRALAISQAQHDRPLEQRMRPGNRIKARAGLGRRVRVFQGEITTAVTRQIR